MSLVGEDMQSTIEIGDVGVNYYITRFMIEDIDNAFKKINISDFVLKNDQKNYCLNQFRIYFSFDIRK